MIDRRKLLIGGAALPGTALLPLSARAGVVAGDSDGAAGDQARFQRKAWRSRYLGTRVWGYADRHSVVPGEKFNLMLSAGPETKPTKGRLEIYRIGHYPGGDPPDRTLVWSADNVAVPQRQALYTAAALGAGWPPGIADISAEGWASGYYSIDFIDERDGHRDRDVAFIVVNSKDRSGDILVWLSTNTYQAYNAWGGASLYESDFIGDRAQAVSFDRPTPPDFFLYEYFIVRWIERFAAERKLKVDYVTNFDIYKDPHHVEPYKVLVSGSHNEYWSKEEFDAVYRRIFELGGNTIFFGADTAYCQVRYEDPNRVNNGADLGRQLVCYKSYDDPIVLRVDAREARLLRTQLFREGARRPETMLVGVGYQSYFPASSPARYPYLVARNDLPFFAGSDYVVGEAIGDVVGYEWDNTDPYGDGKRLWNETSLIRPIDPATIKVVFTGSPIDLNNKPGKAEAVYFVSAAGAKVFGSGTIRWAWGLGKLGFEQQKFQTFNANLLAYFLDHAPGPHPS